MKDKRPSLDRATEITQEVLDELRSEYASSINEDGFAGKVARADEARLAIWSGQSEDGRKHEADLGGALPFPFEGAADVRVRLVDDICQYLVDGYILSWTRGSLGIEGGAERAEELGAIRKYLHYVIFSWMYSDLLTEFELHVNNAVNYGWGVLQFNWDKRQSFRPKRVTVEMLRGFPEFQDLDPSLLEDKREMVLEFLRVTFGLRSKEAKRIVEDLIRDGETTVPVEETVRDKPCVTALRPYRDIVFPSDTADLQDARVIFRREFMSEAELRAIAAVDGWSMDWVEHAVKTTKGLAANPEKLDVRTTDFDFWGDGVLDERIEVIWGYHRAVKNGVTGIYLTVFSPHFQSISGKQGPCYAISSLVTGADDKYPFRLFRLENIRRPIVESRGVPEIARTWEYEVASQLNATIDRSTFDTFPPFEAPLEYGDQLKIEPGAILSTYNRGDLGFVDPPRREPSNAFNLIRALDLRVDRYFGRDNPEIPVDLTLARKQRFIARWLAHLQDVIKAIWEQCRLFESDERFAQIIEVPGARVPRGEHAPAIHVDFDVKTMNSELTLKSLEALAQTIAPLDANQVIDRSEAVRLGLQYLDPALARRLAMSNATASEKVFDEVRKEVAMMALGNEPMLKEEDPAAGTKLQALEQVVAQNPLYQQALNQEGDQSRFTELLLKYQKHLQFQVQQHQVNPQIGRTGVAPA